MNKIEKIKKDLDNFIDSDNINTYKRFFKTNIGEYAHKDIFLGIKVPDIRKIVKKFYFTLNFEEIKEFLHSPYHEYRMFALLVLTHQYKSKKINKKDEIFNFYIINISWVNNWDLIDVTSSHIVGDYLIKKDKSILYEFATSNNLWKKRVSIISTFAFINNGNYHDTLKIADILLEDKHDLIHKAVGWAIRNVGKKDENTMIEFLNQRYKKMPRTMLRYAIEKLPEKLRQNYLKTKI
ncbi:DNA alkylation repair protein [Malaciobacter halophilus]|uniref:DNA alkylation repair protein n=1 Tax=Malaciobacter halophilus TaxID=197482 RepID=A0A2N1J0H2_9BACT|nr:DNA alkylation repair protein [Malaciobacter halophilus]AXH08917.1 AlkD-like DNA glycosylase [Malaciobacter halophilus]PKI80067.1 DNA alkylation repair protein [Malaciobacter halophilus]